MTRENQAGKEPLVMPSNFYGKKTTPNEYIKSVPRKWTDDEIKWCKEKLAQGYTAKELARSIGRTEVSVSIKIKRLGKSSGQYNQKNKDFKYETNKNFLETVNPESVLDLYAGDSFYTGKTNMLVTNDKDKKFKTNYNDDALRVLCQLYANKETFDLVDLDPYGSAYECFDLSIKMANKALVVSFGEWGHKRWKRFDYVRPRYGIENGEQFTVEAFVNEIQRIARTNKKKATPTQVIKYSNFVRVYFVLSREFITEQWSEEE